MSTTEIMCAIAFFGSVIVQFLLLDKVVRTLHNKSPDTWRSIGSPGGYFWWSKDCTFWQGCTSRNKLFVSLLLGKLPDTDHLLKTNRVQWCARIVAGIGLVAWLIITFEQFTK